MLPLSNFKCLICFLYVCQCINSILHNNNGVKFKIINKKDINKPYVEIIKQNVIFNYVLTRKLRIKYKLKLING